MKKRSVISEKDIALYVSGELGVKKAKTVQDAIDRDAELGEYVRKLIDVDEKLSEEFVREYPVPDDFQYFVRTKLEHSELSLLQKFLKKTGLVSLLSGSIGAGIATAFLFGTGATQLAYRSGNEISSFNYPQLYEWVVSEKLAIQFSIFNADHSLKNIVSGNEAKIKVGEFFRVSVMPLEDGSFELKAIDQSKKSVNLIKKTYATKGRVMSHPVQKISGLGEHEFQFFFNNNLRQSIVLVIEE